ncbi:DUF5988 family protein [Actinoplanes sp. DH11]|uniref:DUF5988 family protein n=1 Tax=Actinoplanes sp. DH11 TaxID=2857011 RepID=UPI001E3855C9|nr:DUF5988 family protein [Actinoplanes sp. DH11]
MSFLANTSPPAAGDEPAGIIEITLHGGPADMPVELRTHSVTPDQEKVKVSYYGGYEHFERRITVVEGTDPVTSYHWIGRTRVAE